MNFLGRLRKQKSILINYATPQFYKSQQLNSQSARTLGCLDYCINYSPTDIDAEFMKSNHRILAEQRGAGLWLWKPYIIFKTLRRMRRGDVLFYCDSGALFLQSAQSLVERAAVSRSVVCFSVGLPEYEWSKKDAIVLMDAEQPAILETDQRLAGFQLWYNSRDNIDLAYEYLTHCCDYRIISDAPSTCGLPEDPRFRENRHDQTVFSLLTKKRSIECFPDPSRDHSDKGFPKVIELTRYRKHCADRTLRGQVSHWAESSINWILMAARLRKFV
jgi:hypothetical protein